MIHIKSVVIKYYSITCMNKSKVLIGARKSTVTILHNRLPRGRYRIHIVTKRGTQGKRPVYYKNQLFIILRNNHSKSVQLIVDEPLT